MIASFLGYYFYVCFCFYFFFFFQAEDGIRDRNVTGVQTCALPICIIARLRGFLRRLGTRFFVWVLLAWAFGDKDPVHGHLLEGVRVVFVVFLNVRGCNFLCVLFYRAIQLCREYLNTGKLHQLFEIRLALISSL